MYPKETLKLQTSEKMVNDFELNLINYNFKTFS